MFETALLIKWLGHASFKIKAEGKIIYVDPYEGEYSEKADLILVTHSHSDHCDASKIQKVRKTDTVIIAPEDCFSRIGGSVKTLKPGEETTFGNIRAKAVEAYNYKRFRSPGNPYHPKAINPEIAMPMHRWDTDPEEFKRKVEADSNIMVVVLREGEEYQVA